MTSEIHPAPSEFSAEQLTADPILQYFHYQHLPPQLQGVSRPFCDVAFFLIETVPRNAERSAGLRKLLEAKDCFVRANVPPAGKPKPAYGQPFDDRASFDEDGRTEVKVVGPDRSEEPIPFENDSRSQVDRRDPNYGRTFSGGEPSR